MKGILAFSVLFFVGMIINLSEQDYSNVLVGLLLSGALFAIYLYARREAIKASEFISWLSNNRYQIVREGASYETARIDKDTEITQFQICLSLFIFTTKLSTRYYIKDYNNTVFISSLCSLITLVGGWWGIPFGPIYTIQVVAKNMAGGNKRTAASLFNIVDEAEDKMRQRYSVGRN